MQLVKPHVKYEKSYMEALMESTDETQDKSLTLPKENQSFSDFVNILLSQSKGENLPKDYVPATTYWLIDNDEFIGRVQVRHSLTKSLLQVGGHIGYYIRPSKRRKGYGVKILELGLLKARSLGILNVLVTCDINNLGSKKIIESNGGILENTFDEGSGKPVKLRYWIKPK